MVPTPHRLVFGTAGLVQAYAGHSQRPERQAEVLIERALAVGIRAFDTAPTYGAAEMVLGNVLRLKDVFVSTKVMPGSYKCVRQSLERSQKALRRWHLDLVQIHNASVADLESPTMDVLQEAKANGTVRFIGASVYSVEAAWAALAVCDQVQVPYNLLDRRMAHVIKAAKAANCAVWARSVWLRGALTPAGNPQAATLSCCPEATGLLADIMRRRLWATWEALPDLALQFVLTTPVAAALIGPQNAFELEEAVRAAQRGPLSWWRQALARTLPDHSVGLVDPRFWP